METYITAIVTKKYRFFGIAKVQKPTHRTTQKHVEHHEATDIEKKDTFLGVFVSDFSSLFYFSPRKVELPPWYGQTAHWSKATGDGSF